MPVYSIHFVFVVVKILSLNENNLAVCFNHKNTNFYFVFESKATWRLRNHYHQKDVISLCFYLLYTNQEFFQMCG